MKDKALGVWEKIKSFFGAMSKGMKILLAVVVTLVLGVLLAFAIINGSKSYVVLFTDLTDTSKNSVVTYLSDNGVTDFRVEGDSILVSEEQEVALKAQLIMAGYPETGFGYETYYEYLSGMSTDTDKENAYIQHLETRQAAVIRQFEGVRDAVVTIGEGQDYRYILDSNNATPTSVQIVVTMEEGKTLSKDVASAIRRSVTAAVKGLNIENVDITDTTGNSYSEVATSGDAVSEATQIKLQMEEDINNQVRSEVLKAVTPFYGASNVTVSVRTVVDVDRKLVSLTDYPMPVDWLGEDGGEDGRGILDTEIWSNYVYSEDGGTVGGVVGAGVNSDITIYPGDANGDGVPDTWGSTSGENVYKNPEEVTQREVLAGTVTDISVAVSINADVESTLTTQELVSHVAVAAGMDFNTAEDKVSIIVAPFNIEEVEAEQDGIVIQTWMLFAALGGLALFIILLIVFILLSRKKKREREEQEALEAEMARQEEERLAALEVIPDPVDGADIMDVNTEKSMELRKELRAFVGNNPEIAAALLKNLMKGGEVESA